MRTPALALLVSLLAASPVAGQNDTAGTTVPKHTLEVQVFDAHTKQPLAPAELVLHAEGVEIMRFSREDTVPFRTELPYLPRIDGVVSLSSQHALGSRFSILPQEHSEETTFTIEVFIHVCVHSESISIPEIPFPRNSALLSSEARDSLAIIEDMFSMNPTIVVELGGHVDATEDESFAVKRCETVQDHLIGLGISKGRIPTQAYGKQRPRIVEEQIERMVTEEEREAAHALNRRVDFQIVGWDWLPGEE